MLIPFSQPLGKTNGVDSDGCIFSKLSYKKPIAAYTSTVLSPSGRIYRGNADVSGNVSYSDVTTALSIIGGSAVSLFDTVNPTADELWIDIQNTETIDGFCLYVTTAGVYTGTAHCDVRYRNTSGQWTIVDCTLSSQFNTVGMKYINFGTSINGSTVALADALINPVTNPQLRRILIKFTDITAVTTAPLFDRLSRLLPAASRVLTGLNSYLVDDVNNIPASFDTLEILPMVGDRTMFCFNMPFAKTKINLKRARITANAKVVYSKGNNQYGDITFLEMNSDSDTRVNQWLTLAPATTVEATDTIMPPTDWAQQTINLGGTDYTGYWIGLEYTADDSAPLLAMLLTLKAGMWIEAEIDGETASESIAATKFSIHLRDGVDAETKYLLVHITSKKYVVLTLPANGTYAETAINMGMTKGDKLILQQLTGSETSVPTDGHFTIA